MRPLAIVCEETHAQKIRANLEALCHPAVLANFVIVVPIDTASGSDYASERSVLFTWINKPPDGASDHALICHTPDAGRAFKVRPMAQLTDCELRQESLKRLTKNETQNGDSLPLQAILNQCGLSLRSASATLASHWLHAKVDRRTIDLWIEQFCRLGPYKWIAEAILGSLQLIEQSRLGNLYEGLEIAPTFALCVNSDPRGNPKSSEVIANLLKKRFSGKKIYTSPAQAIEDGKEREVAVFEDGLWSGTEAIGVIESLLGERPTKLKTRQLADPDLLHHVDIKFVYGTATDYGSALVQRFLQDKGLQKVEIISASTIQIASPGLLTALASDGLDFPKMRDQGPGAVDLCPHVLHALAKNSASPEQAADALQFCIDVGGQLFGNYLNMMATASGWTSWPAEKLLNASLGMHGLGLTHAFGHSVPKATLPLLWGRGPVVIGPRSVDWKPLFENA